MGSRDRLSIIAPRQPEVPGGQPWNTSRGQSIRQEQGQEIQQDVSRREERNCGLIDEFEYLGGGKMRLPLIAEKTKMLCQEENHQQYSPNNDNVSTDYWCK